MKRKVKDISRRNFVIRSSQATAGILAASPFLACASQKNKKSKPGSDMKLGLVTTKDEVFKGLLMPLKNLSA